MDRVFIKPTSREILIKDSNKEGYLDIYSYDYNADENKRVLGSLYLIGNVNQPEESTEETTNDAHDIAYMVNLVASLAKREYYSKPSLTPKEAFAGTLKKINEIVDEFFKNRGVRINIGMFAVAGEDILISKLGKFKIILNRDNQAIDILNNITLFNKEHVEEKEFSNIISGKIRHGDKLLAYYPSRFITSREKTIRDHFLKLTWTDFVDKINAIKSTRTDAACAALYIDLNKVKEPAIRLASTDVVSPENKEVSTALDVKELELPAPSVHEQEIKKEEQPIEIPKIIPSEFSRAQKENMFSKFFSKFKSFRRQDSFGHIGGRSGWRLAPKKGVAYAVPVLVVLIAGGFFAKQYVFISAEEKEARKVTKEIKENIRLAKDQLGSDPSSARQLLLGSLLKSGSDELDKEVLELLDQADNAVLVSPVLVEGLPEEIKKKADILMQLNSTGDLYEDNLYSISGNQISKVIDAAKGSTNSVNWLKEGVSLGADSVGIAVDGNVFVLNKSGLVTKYYKGDKVNEFNTSVASEDVAFLTAKDLPGLYLINKKLGRIYVADKETGAFVKVVKLGNTEPFTNAYLDAQGVVYLTSQDSKIWKVE